MNKPLPVSLVQQVFAELGDGRLRSGAELAAQFGVSRTAIWKSVSTLRALGVAIASVPRKGYQSEARYTPLRNGVIDQQLGRDGRIALRRGAVCWSTVSTNAALLASDAPGPGSFDYLLAEHQSSGRGRRGRKWFATPGSAICLSMNWCYSALPPAAGALSLAVGVGVWRVLRRLGVEEPRLKWPNDVVLGRRKLCGILLELRAEVAGPALVVVGIGLNVAIDAAARREIAATGTDPVDLREAGIAAVDRNVWAAALIAETAATLQTFGHSGFASFESDWRSADAFAGQSVQVTGASGQTVGSAEGIDADGALRVRTAAGLQRFTSGDVSVRSRP